MKSIFKKKEEPKVHLTHIAGLSLDSPWDVPESAAYDILHSHIEKYEFYKKQIASLEKPKIDPKDRDIYIRLINDTCDGNINMNEWNAYAAQLGLDEAKIRKTCFTLGEYLSNIISYGESLQMFQRNIMKEADIIKQIQIALGIGVE